MADERRGLEIREAHYPRRAPVDGYGGGRFRFAGMAHTGALICVPSGIYAWDRSRPDALVAEDLERVFAEADDIELLLIGGGADPVFVPEPLRVRCREANIVVEAMATGPAVRTYNVLLADERRVAAALAPVG